MGKMNIPLLLQQLKLLQLKKKVLDSPVKTEQDPSRESNSTSNNNLFYVGKKFHTISDFDEAKAKYEAHNFCELWKRDVRTLASAQKRAPKRVANADLVFNINP